MLYTSPHAAINDTVNIVMKNARAEEYLGRRGKDGSWRRIVGEKDGNANEGIANAS